MKCKICAHNVHLVDKKNHIGYCENCDVYETYNLQYSAPENPEAEERVMDSLVEVRRNNYQILLKKLREIFGDSNDVQGLDIGCARGWFMKEAQAFGYVMDGIEPEPQFFDEAKLIGRYVANGLFPQDFHPEGVQEKRYDFIIFNDVFEHLPDLNEIVSHCYALLKEEGVLVINCPNSHGMLFKIAKTLHCIRVNYFWNRLWQLDFYSPHLWYFSPKSLDSLMGKFSLKYVCESNLATYTISGLKKRVMCEGNSVIGWIAYFILYMGFPLLRILPSDIVCRFYKKQ